MTGRLIDFYTRGLWLPQPKGWRTWLYGIAQRVVLATDTFLEERMQYRASAMTYVTLFSLVPVLGIVFAFAKGFGLAQLIEQEMRRIFDSQPEVVDTLLSFVNSYLSHTKSGVFFGFGFLLLLWSLISLTMSVETTFNQIWRVKRERTLLRKVTDYMAVFFLLPILILLSSGLSVFVSSFVNTLSADYVLHWAGLLALKVLPFLLSAVIFTLLYAFMPNTHVGWRSAVCAGVPAGLAFQALQFFYFSVQVRVSSYNAVYGSFAALPLLMLWMQLSWYICLWGAALSYVDRNIEGLRAERLTPRLSRRVYDAVCLKVGRAVCQRFLSREAAPTAADVAATTGLPVCRVTEVLERLCRAGICCVNATDEKDREPIYQPRFDVHQLTIAEFFRLLEQDGGAGETPSGDDGISDYEAYKNACAALEIAQKKIYEIS